MRKSNAKKRPPKSALLEAIYKYMGNLSLVAKQYNVTYATVHHWVNHYDLRPELEKAREPVVDLAEAKMLEKLQEGDSRMIEFVLRTLGRKRGYAEQTELQHGGQVTIRVVYDDE